MENQLAGTNLLYNAAFAISIGMNVYLLILTMSYQNSIRVWQDRCVVAIDLAKQFQEHFEQLRRLHDYALDYILKSQKKGV